MIVSLHLLTFLPQHDRQMDGQTGAIIAITALITADVR